MSFKSLPHEVHLEIAIYLPAHDRVALSQLCAKLRGVYRSASWRAVIVNNEIRKSCFNGWKVDERYQQCFPGLRLVPLYVVQDPKHFTWFCPELVGKIVLQDGVLHSDIVVYQDTWPSLRQLQNLISFAGKRDSRAVFLTRRVLASQSSRSLEKVKFYDDYESLGDCFLLMQKDRIARSSLQLESLVSFRHDFCGQRWAAYTTLCLHLLGLPKLAAVHIAFDDHMLGAPLNIAHMFDYWSMISKRHPDFRPAKFVLELKSLKGKQIRVPSPDFETQVPIVTRLELKKVSVNIFQGKYAFPSLSSAEFLETPRATKTTIDEMALALRPLKISAAETLATVHLTISDFLHCELVPVRQLSNLQRLAICIRQHELSDSFSPAYGRYLAQFVQKYAVREDFEAVRRDAAACALRRCYKSFGSLSSAYELLCFGCTFGCPQVIGECALSALAAASLSCDFAHSPYCSVKRFKAFFWERDVLDRRLRLEALVKDVCRAATNHGRLEYVSFVCDATFPAPFFLHRLVQFPGSIKQLLWSMRCDEADKGIDAPDHPYKTEVKTWTAPGKGLYKGALYDFGLKRRFAKQNFKLSDCLVFGDGEDFCGWI